MENLLRNPGFEEAWGSENSHRVLILPAYGEPFVLESGNIFTPPGWLTWFRHEPGEWDQPEVKLMHWAQYEERVNSGQMAVCMFSFARRHDGGFLQQVHVPDYGMVTVFLRSSARWKFKHNDAYWDDVGLSLDGAHLTLRAWAHAWSNHNLDGHDDCFENGDCSCGVGWEAVRLVEGEAPEPNGDPWNDAVCNFLFLVGIDPEGGMDPTAESVVWGQRAHIYNRYAEVPAVTCRLAGMLGRPREQYARTYVLLPPGADRTWAAAAVTGGWGKYRFTIGGSADDAGIGDLERRRVVAVNPQLWPEDLAAWLERHYPGVVCLPVEAATPAALAEKLAEIGDFGVNDG